MKKQPAAVLAFVLLALSLTGCGTTDKPGNPASSPNAGAGQPASPGNNSGTGLPYGDAQDYIAQHLPAEFSITYRISKTVTTDVSTSMIRTSEGYYCERDDGIGSLFIKNGDLYDLYDGTPSTGFDKSDAPAQDQAAVDLGCEAHWMMTYHANFLQQMQPAGQGQVVGRDADKYVTGLQGYASSTFWIDRETGIALKMEAELTGEIPFVFEITKFQTSNVSLPAHG